MKAKQLMLGNYALYNGLAVRIHNIHDNVFLDGGDESVEVVYDDGVVVLVDPCSLDPIPITPEILENNGFKKKHPTQHFCEIVIGGFRITVQFGYGNKIDYVRIYETPNDNYIPETNIHIYHPKIKYIHELQNFINLCAIEKEIKL